MSRRATVSVGEKKVCCACADQFSVASQQNIPSYFPYFGTNQPVDIVLVTYSSEENKWKDLRSVNINKATFENKKVEEAWTGQLNAKNVVATVEVLKERAKMIASTVPYYSNQSSYCTYL